jgi:dUTP pyrophosphatase
MIFAKYKKLHPDAIEPQYSLSGDGCLDLWAVSREEDNMGNIVFGTGIAMEIPEGCVGLLFPRSSVTKTQFVLGNSVGVIDSNYRGEIQLKFTGVRLSKVQASDFYLPGSKIGQILIIPRPQVVLLESEELSDTNRGEGGFGSTGT